MVWIMFVGIMGLVTGFLLYYVDPKFILENIDVSSASSITIQATPTSLFQVQNESNGEYYGMQFKTDKLQLKQAPELSQATGFVNTGPISLSDLKGKVVLVHFWTYTCINCINTVPFLNGWYQKYAGENFEIVGIHTPEFEFEKNLENVKNAVGKFEIKYLIWAPNNVSAKFSGHSPLPGP